MHMYLSFFVTKNRLSEITFCMMAEVVLSAAEPAHKIMSTMPHKSFLTWLYFFSLTLTFTLRGR